MKNEFRILILFIAIIFFQNIFGQQEKHKNYATYEIMYEFSSETNAEKLNAAPPAMRKTAADVEKIITESRSVLLCNRSYSCNYVETPINTEGMAESMAKSIMMSKNMYFINLPSKSVKIKQYLPGEISTYILDDKIKWDITEETAMVNGIKCIKALGTIFTPGFNDSKITAWYTPDYPISMGPRGLYGLPGLILKYRTGNIILTAKSIRNIESQKKEIEDPSSENLKSYSETLLKSKSMLPKK